jgi:hypothetical protein
MRGRWTDRSEELYRKTGCGYWIEYPNRSWYRHCRGPSRDLTIILEREWQRDGWTARLIAKPTRPHEEPLRRTVGAGEPA